MRKIIVTNTHTYITIKSEFIVKVRHFLQAFVLKIILLEIIYIYTSTYYKQKTNIYRNTLTQKHTPRTLTHTATLLSNNFIFINL